MRRLLGLVTLSFVVVSTAAAQGKASFGVLAGAVFGRVGGADTKDVDVKTRVGLGGGGFVTIQANRNFAIEPEALFVMKGAKETQSGITGSVKVSYLEVPLLAKVRMPSKSGGLVSPHFYAGPYFAVKAGCTVKLTDGTTTVSGSCKSQDVNLKGSDFGATFGVGVDVNRAIIDVRYDLGLSKISDETTNNDVKTRTLYFLAGWTFRAPR